MVQKRHYWTRADDKDWWPQQSSQFLWQNLESPWLLWELQKGWHPWEMGFLENTCILLTGSCLTQKSSRCRRLGDTSGGIIMRRNIWIQAYCTVIGLGNLMQTSCSFNLYLGHLQPTISSFFAGDRRKFHRYDEKFILIAIMVSPTACLVL